MIRQAVILSTAWFTGDSDEGDSAYASVTEGEDIIISRIVDGQDDDGEKFDRVVLTLDELEAIYNLAQKQLTEKD